VLRVCDFSENELILEKKGTVVFAGRGPSSVPHLGHILVLDVLRSLNVGVFFQISDDEKNFRSGVSIQDSRDWSRVYEANLTKPNHRIFRNSQHSGRLYDYFCRYCRTTKVKQPQRLFGYTADTPLGLLVYSLIQAITPRLILDDNPECSNLIVLTGEDQIPYFVKTSELTGIELTILKIKTVPGLRGELKMTSSKPTSCIFYEDKLSDILSKLNREPSAGNALNSVPTSEGLQKDFTYNLLTTMFSIGKNLSSVSKLLADYRSGGISSMDFKDKSAGLIHEYLNRF
jgi:tryptophanyl-tRNA synthetase